jgi:hypothetical protein
LFCLKNKKAILSENAPIKIVIEIVVNNNIKTRFVVVLTVNNLFQKSLKPLLLNKLSSTLTFDLALNTQALIAIIVMKTIKP